MSVLRAVFSAGRLFGLVLPRGMSSPSARTPQQTQLRSTAARAAAADVQGVCGVWLSPCLQTRRYRRPSPRSLIQRHRLLTPATRMVRFCCLFLSFLQFTDRTRADTPEQILPHIF
ncbi:hypothetical protein BC628DRAFT_789532 [Trametes gibbosa]|nr:hypothetical protein BC628DRAFT_789532 [Trametes gibbosa]